jgi:hypothetical protein
MKKPLGLALKNMNEHATQIPTGKKSSRGRTQQRMQQNTAKLESLEKWFLSDQQRPAPTSVIAQQVRTLPAELPELSFDRLRLLARSWKENQS